MENVQVKNFIGMSYTAEENPPHLLKVLMFGAEVASTIEMLI